MENFLKYACSMNWKRLFLEEKGGFRQLLSVILSAKRWFCRLSSEKLPEFLPGKKTKKKIELSEIYRIKAPFTKNVLSIKYQLYVKSNDN